MGIITILQSYYNIPSGSIPPQDIGKLQQAGIFSGATCRARQYRFIH